MEYLALCDASMSAAVLVCEWHKALGIILFLSIPTISLLVPAFRLRSHIAKNRNEVRVCPLCAFVGACGWVGVGACGWVCKWVWVSVGGAGVSLRCVWVGV